MSFDETSIDCKVNSCKAYCTDRAQAYTRLNETLANKIESKFISINTNNHYSDLKRSIPVQLSAQLYIGSIGIRELYIKPTKCELTIVKSYGCNSCSVKPYIQS